jgi:glycosyltransferase
LSPKIGIIIPSYNDKRIVHAILSVIKHDPANLTRLYIIDGGSQPEVVDLIRRHIRPHDYFKSEKDKGIFDALNKGLDAIDEEYLSWLGSDDFFTQHTDFAAVVSAFNAENLDCYQYDLVFADEMQSRRRTVAFAPTLSNLRLGRHAQHFSSFWRKSRIGTTRFDLKYKIAADINLFCEMAHPVPSKTKLDHRVGTIARLGGISTKDIRHIIKSNTEVFHIYRKYMGTGSALFATLCKVARKGISQMKMDRYAVIGEMTDLITRI